MSDPCNQSERIKNIEIQVNSITSILSGKDGLMAIVSKQSEITKTQGDNIDKLMGIVDALRVKDIQTDKEKEVIIKLSKERQNYRRWLTGSLIGIGGLILTIIGLLLHKLL